MSLIKVHMTRFNSTLSHMTLFIHTGPAAVCGEHRAGTGPAGLPGHCQQLQEGGGRDATAGRTEGEA